MKRKIRITDNVSNKVVEGEMTLRNTLHFEIQQRNHACVFNNKKTYTRKEKHKNKNY